VLCELPDAEGADERWSDGGSADELELLLEGDVLCELLLEGDVLCEVLLEGDVLWELLLEDDGLVVL
jgi:hypothetical protein